MTQRDATIRDLEANKTCLSQAQTESASKIDSLETKLSELAQGLTSEDEELCSHVSIAALKDPKLLALGAMNADHNLSTRGGEK